MIKSARQWHSFVLLSVCALALTACTYTSDYGTPASEQEIINHISGKSSVGANGGSYYAADGTLKLYRKTPDISFYGTGTWSVRGKELVMQSSGLAKKNGKIEAYSVGTYGVFVIIRSDGSFILKEPGSIGASANPYNAPTKGFVFEKEFNSMRREFGG